MSENCCYSFLDLFKAANGRAWSEEEQERFRNLPQDEKNAEVRRLVALTNGAWLCEDRLWGDGITYTAFWKTSAARTPQS